MRCKDHSLGSSVATSQPARLDLDQYVLPAVRLEGALTILVLVTIGNLIGGTILVASVYWLAYLRPGALLRADEDAPK